MSDDDSAVSSGGEQQEESEGWTYAASLLYNRVEFKLRPVKPVVSLICLPLLFEFYHIVEALLSTILLFFKGM